MNKSFLSSSEPMSLLLTQVQCDETLARTSLCCDAMTEFQRIVSLCVAERHGCWGFEQASASPHQYCAQCGGERRTVKQRQVPEALTGLGIEQRIETSYCNMDEQNSIRGCRFTENAMTQVERKDAFRSDESRYIERIMQASRGIRNAIT